MQWTTCCSHHSQSNQGECARGARVAGDVVLDGLFPVHEKRENTDQTCEEKLYNRGLQRIEAMLYAVDE